VVVADFSGEAIYSESLDTPADVPAERVMTELSGLARRAVRSVGLEKAEERVLGIGVGAPGIVDIDSGTVVRYPRIRGLDGYGVGARLEVEFGWPVHVHNNTAVLALGEYRYGAAAGYQSVMALLIRSGVGGAFLQDGRVLTNRGRTLLEVGHMVLDPDGAECGSGRRGCLEGYLSENALAAVIEEAGFGDLSEMGPATAAYVEGIDDPVERAVSRLSGILEVCPRLREPGERFAQLIHSLSNLLNSEAYLLVSRYGWLSEFVAGAVHRYLESDTPGLSEGAAVVIPRTYDPIRACHGAADLVIDRFFARE
jgi:predicted NBD/HSP70 family sugar kinase